MNKECSRCGQCCTWIPIGNSRGMTPWQLDYLRKRCHKEVGGMFLVHAPCEHLTLIGNGQRVCKIYEGRPQICKDFCGKRFSHGSDYYVPEECTMKEDK